jgi:uncharacterized protein YqfA (UPF0365 family)
MMAQIAASCCALIDAAILGGTSDARDFARLSLAALLLLPFLIALIDASWHARRASRNGAPIPRSAIIAMRLRRIDPAVIVRAHGAAVAAGLGIPLATLQSRYRAFARRQQPHAAGIQLARAVHALCVAKAAGIPLSPDLAWAIESSGRDSAAAVAGAMTPRPLRFGDGLPAGGGTVAGTTRDGVMLSAGGTATVRLNLERLVGGAGEDALRARLGEAVSTAIGAADDAGTLIDAPATLARAVLAAGLDAGTAFTLDGLAITLRRTGMHHGARAAGGPPP